MLKFPHHLCKRTKDGASYIKDAVIEDFAEQMLMDYKSELLEKPQIISWSDFLEFYLERYIQFAQILPYPNDNEDILGTCSFDDLVPLPVHNREKNCKEIIEINTGDIVLHSMLEDQPQRLLFTALHEGGHWVMHQPYYFSKSKRGQISFFGDTEKIIQCCRKSDIEKNGKRTLETTIDHLEHQANVFAATIAVPRKTLLKVAPKLLAEHGFALCKTKDSINEQKLERLMIEAEVAEIFGVSKKVAEIRLEQLGVWYEKTQVALWANEQFIDWSGINEVLP